MQEKNIPNTTKRGSPLGINFVFPEHPFFHVWKWCREIWFLIHWCTEQISSKKYPVTFIPHLSNIPQIVYWGLDARADVWTHKTSEYRSHCNQTLPVSITLIFLWGLSLCTFQWVQQVSPILWEKHCTFSICYSSWSHTDLKLTERSSWFCKMCEQKGNERKGNVCKCQGYYGNNAYTTYGIPLRPVQWRLYWRSSLVLVLDPCRIHGEV